MKFYNIPLGTWFFAGWAEDFRRLFNLGVQTNSADEVLANELVQVVLLAADEAQNRNFWTRIREDNQFAVFEGGHHKVILENFHGVDLRVKEELDLIL